MIHSTFIASTALYKWIKSEGSRAKDPRCVVHSLWALPLPFLSLHSYCSIALERSAWGVGVAMEPSVRSNLKLFSRCGKQLTNQKTSHGWPLVNQGKPMETKNVTPQQSLARHQLQLESSLEAPPTRLKYYSK